MVASVQAGGKTKASLKNAKVLKKTPLKLDEMKMLKNEVPLANLAGTGIKLAGKALQAVLGKTAAKKATAASLKAAAKKAETKAALKAAAKKAPLKEPKSAVKVTKEPLSGNTRSVQNTTAKREAENIKSGNYARESAAYEERWGNLARGKKIVKIK